MTFSLTARCARTGMFGVVVTSSSSAVAARCAWAAGHVGAVATQNITDPGLGLMGLDLMRQGYGARAAMEILVRARAFSRLSASSPSSMPSATPRTIPAHASSGTNNVVEGRDCVSAGNLLKTPKVPEAMVAAFEANAADHLAERLLKRRRGGACGGRRGRPRALGRAQGRPHARLADLRVAGRLARRADRRVAPGLGRLPAPDGRLCPARHGPARRPLLRRAWRSLNGDRRDQRTVVGPDLRAGPDRVDGQIGRHQDVVERKAERTEQVGPGRRDVVA